MPYVDECDYCGERKESVRRLRSTWRWLCDECMSDAPNPDGQF